MYAVTPGHAEPDNESSDPHPAHGRRVTLDVVMEVTPTSLSRVFCLAATLAIVPSGMRVSVDEDRLFMVLEFERTAAGAVDLLQRKLSQLAEVMIAVTSP